MNKENNPKELEYWKKIFPSKTEEELEVYRSKWGKENSDYLKFKRLQSEKYKSTNIQEFIDIDVDKTMSKVSKYIISNNSFNPLVGCIIKDEQKSLYILNETEDFIERIEFEGIDNKWIEKDYKLANKNNAHI